MPERIHCPECNTTLRVPDTLLGKNVKCPKCKATFTAEADAPEERERIANEPVRSSRRSSPPAEEDDNDRSPQDEDDDRPRRRRRRRRSSEAASLVSGPAICLMVVSSLGIAVSILDLIFRIVGISLLAGASRRRGMPSGYEAGHSVGVVLGGGFDILSIILSIVLIVGAVKMKNLQSYGLAMTACILGMLPLHCCCVLSLPFGIWGVVMLNNADVKDAFS